MRRKKARTRTPRRTLRYDAPGEALVGAAARLASAPYRPLSEAEAEAFRRSSIDYWRHRPPDEEPDAAHKARAFYDHWQQKHGASVYEVAHMVGANVAAHAGQQALRARIVVAGWLRRLLEEHLRDWRREAARSIPGTSSTLAEVEERAARAYAGTHAARRRLDPNEGMPWPVSLQEVIRRHEAWITFLLEQSAVVLAERENKVRHEGTKAGDAEWNRMAAALEDWMREHGGIDWTDAVRFFEFCGHALGRCGDPKSQREAMRLKEDRLRAAAKRYRRRSRAVPVRTPRRRSA